MGTVTIMHDGHRIQVEWSVWTGKEKVLYDGRIVSDKQTVTGGTHIFIVEENLESIQYEVSFGFGFTSPSIEVRRNGIIIYTSR